MKNTSKRKPQKRRSRNIGEFQNMVTEFQKFGPDVVFWVPIVVSYFDGRKKLQISENKWSEI
jgi:hypothetical protein